MIPPTGSPPRSPKTAIVPPKEYEPKTDYERILVEYGKIELEGLTGKK